MQITYNGFWKHIPTKKWIELSYLDFNDKLEWCMRERIGDGFETLTILIQLGDHKLLKPQYLIRSYCIYAKWRKTWPVLSIHMKSFIENELETMTIHLIFYSLFFPSTQGRPTRVTNPSRLAINTWSVPLSFCCGFLYFLLLV